MSSRYSFSKIINLIAVLFLYTCTIDATQISVTAGNSHTVPAGTTVTHSGGTLATIEPGSTLTIDGSLITNSADTVILGSGSLGTTANITIGATGVVSRDSGAGGNYAMDLRVPTQIYNNQYTVHNYGSIIGSIISHGFTRIFLYPGATVTGDITLHRDVWSTVNVHGTFTTAGDIDAYSVEVRNGATFNIESVINPQGVRLHSGSRVNINSPNGDLLVSTRFSVLSGGHYVQNNSLSGTDVRDLALFNGSTVTINSGQTMTAHRDSFLDGTITLNNSTLRLQDAMLTPRTATIGKFAAGAVMNLNSSTLDITGTLVADKSATFNILGPSTINTTVGFTISSANFVYKPTSFTTLPLLTLNSGAAVDFSNATLKADLSAISLNAGTYTLATNTNASGISANSANATVDFPRRFTSTLSVSAGNLIVNLVKKNIVNVITHRHAREMLPRMSTLATSNSQMAEIENAMLDLSSEDIEYAAKQLTPEVNGASTSSAVLAGQSVSRVALDRLAALRDTNIATTGYVTGDINNDLAIWYKVFGGKIHQNKRKNVAGYDASLGGLAIGIDQAFTNSTTAGLGCSIANTNIKSRLVNAPNATNIVSYQGIAYGSFDNNNLFIDGAVNYANNRYVGNRIFKFGTIDRKALFKHHGHQFGIVLESGSKFYNNGGLNLKPIIYLSYIHSSKNPYTENVAESSDIGLKFDRSKTTRIDGGIGFKISKNFKTIDRRWTPNLHLSWTPNFHLRIIHDFKRARQASVSRFVGGGAAFATTGPRPARNVLNVGVGVKILSGDNFEFSAKYELEGKEHYLSYNGSFSARYMF